ncbi:efflux RND transporter periplasmic adaptor subunit [Humisphaera borealis]|uniref:Efflux RND transporter periplasmic adaptor subunit n=1 Tax=Humisphaera borealis TaxID=2807512 RepID=A0A7M2WQ72_9BACT|nr:efflux RND transporter periplasmic adaptor subunit [Humisphaera borealis]QOV87675.1 efflux RND transporter periplasmic adaptor subunit [Humisphaera borealis]
MRAEQKSPLREQQNGQPPVDGSPPDQARGHAEPEAAIELPPVSRSAIVITVVLIVALFATLFVIGFVPHKKKMAQAGEDANELASAKPIVNVTVPRALSKDPILLLPGDVRAMQSTALYPRTNGYVTELLVDIGDRVRGPQPAKDDQPAKPGQPLARITAPEVDAELEQAKATLEQAKVVVGRATNEFNFNQATYERYQGLAKTGGVTQQQLDERRSAFNIANSNLKAANANVLAAEASVKRYTQLQSFQTIYAPFDGVITSRNFDVGTRVSESDTGAGRELFQVQQTDTLRVFANVPQSYVTSLNREEEAELTVRTQGGPPIRVKGKIARTAESLDAQTRTLRVELHMSNAGGKLLPGMFGDVRFKLAREGQPMVIPTSALVYGADGLRVAVVDGQNRVQLRKVTLGRDFGVEAEVAEGVKAGERVVTNPGDRIVDGVEVQIAGGGAAKPPVAEAPPPVPATRPSASAQ